MRLARRRGAMRALVVLSLVAAAFALLPAGTAGHPFCLPVQHPVLVEQATPAGTFYLAQYFDHGFTATGVFQERNGFAGLQISSFEACDHQEDLFRGGACPGVGPSLPGATILCIVEIQ